MGVEITQDELDIFAKNGISENDIKNTVDLYRSEGISDEDIRAKFNNKLNSFQNETQTNELARHHNNIETSHNAETQQYIMQQEEQEKPYASQDNVLTGGISKNVRTYWDKKGRIHYENTEQPKLNWFKHQGRKIKAGVTNVGNYIKESNPDSDMYKQKANLVLALSTLPMGAGSQVTKWGTAKLTPIIGRKMAKGIAQGIGGGFVSGGVEGIGRGFIEGENPIISGLIDATIGGISGGLGSAAILKGLKISRGAKLKKIDNLKDLRKAETDFYKDYIQQTSTKQKDLGDIKFTQSGLETVSKTPQAGRNFDTLKNDIKKAEYIEAELPNHQRKDDIIKFHKLKNSENEFLIGETSGGKKYYMSKMKDGLETRPSRGGTNPSDNIIPNNEVNLNPDIVNGKVIPQNAELLDSIRANSELKSSKLPQNADLPEGVSKIISEIPPEYEVLHNENLIRNAKAALADNAAARKIRLEDLADNNEVLSAQDFEEARQLVGQLYKEGRIDEAVKLTEKISIAGSKAGQSVQALSLWAKTTPEGAIKQAQKIISEYNLKNKKKVPALTQEQAKDIIKLTENIHTATENRATDVATAKLMKYFSNLVPSNNWQKIKTIRNLSLLLNPKTIGRNIAGNALFNSVDTGSKYLAGGIDKALSLFTKKRTRVSPQIAKSIKGALSGAKEGYEDAILGIDTRKGIGGRFDLPSQRSFKNPIGNFLETALDIGLRVPDRAFYQGAFDESITNQLMAKGVNKATPEMLDNARKEALEAVFQDDSLTSRVVLDVRRALNKIGNKNLGLGDFVIPYAQTPANIIQQGINYSPVGAIKGGLNLAKGNQRQASLDFARSLAGTGLIGGGYAMAKNGIVSGDNEDFQAKKNLETINERPFQMKLPNGSNMSYSQLQPMSIPLSAGAALAQPDKEKAIDAATGTLLDLPMLDSIERFESDRRNYGVGTAATNLAMNIPTQFIPTALNQVNAYVDPYQRETYDPNPIMRGLNQARNKIPFASKTLPKKYNVKGEEIPKYESKGVAKAYDVFLNPVFINKPKNDVVMNEVKALYDITGEEKSLLYVPERKIKLDDGSEKELSNKEYSEYSKKLGETTYKAFSAIMDTRRYQNADNETRLNLLSDIKRNTKAIVQEELFGKANKYSSKNAIKRKAKNRLYKGQNKIDRIFNKIDGHLVDEIMYGE